MRARISAIAWLLIGLLIDVAVAAAQQPGRVYKIGFLNLGSPDFAYPPMEEWKGTGATLRDALRDRGYVLGKNLVVELRHAHGDVERLAPEAEALVASNVDVIVSGGTSPTLAASSSSA
jgi:putative tryptophan/tyrosine transport system substrate-binding protein